MKQVNRLLKKQMPLILNASLLIACLLLISLCQAQRKKKNNENTVAQNNGQVTPNNAQVTPVNSGSAVATNMKDYAKTPKGVARKQKYKDTYSKGPATKEIKYPDGSTLHLKMVRNP